MLPNGDNTTEQTIYLRLKEGLKVDCGAKNRLTSTSHSGANAGARGSNVALSFTYTNQNDCTVTHPQDPTTALAG